MMRRGLKIMNNFKELFESVDSTISIYQKKVHLKSPLGVYWGYSQDGFLRISFLSKQAAPVLESTKLLRVTQGIESEGFFWTCFDLLQFDAKNVFYAFCENMVECVTGDIYEHQALLNLRKRYTTWKTMFKNKSEQKLSKEVMQGLFGELYFLKNHMIPNYGSEKAIKAWSGIDSKSKDFSVDRTWYEIKTIGCNVDELHISSLTQLSAKEDGHLVAIKVESMSDSYDALDSDVCSLIKAVISLLDNEILEEMFAQKISKIVGNINDDFLSSKYQVKEMSFYLVNEHFPRLTEDNKKFAEIGNVQYTLIINMLDKYRENR